jgi:hypothetical protein
MRRIPWFAVAVLAGLLVVTFPLANAQLLPQQQVGVGAYLPLVYQPYGISFDIDELDSDYYVDDDVSVVGTLLDTWGDGIANAAVTVRYTINGVDAGLWCTATTDRNGDWECPDKVVLASWVSKTIRITASVAIQGRALTDSAEFTVVVE